MPCPLFGCMYGVNDFAFGNSDGDTEYGPVMTPSQTPPQKIRSAEPEVSYGEAISIHLHEISYKLTKTGPVNSGAATGIRGTVKSSPMPKGHLVASAIFATAGSK
jgi:hypothetical protein